MRNKSRENLIYVHLSSDVDTAEKVGQRHGKEVVYQVASEMRSRFWEIVKKYRSTENDSELTPESNTFDLES